MKKAEIEQCEQLIQDWYKSDDPITKDKKRNALFMHLQAPMDKWVSGILSRKGIFLEKEEMISRTWDCFNHGLNHHRLERNIPILNHFFTYTRFFLAEEVRKEKTDKTTMNEVLNENEYIDTVNIDICTALDHLDELQTFRKYLPPYYVPVFDDALASMLPDNRQRVRRLDATNISPKNYNEVKKIFKCIIEFLLLH